MSNFAELSLRKPYIVESCTTTRSKDNCLNCGVGGLKKIGITLWRHCDVIKSRFSQKVASFPNFATSRLRKVKEMGANPTTHFEDNCLNCGVGEFNFFWNHIMKLWRHYDVINSSEIFTIFSQNVAFSSPNYTIKKESRVKIMPAPS